MRPIAHVVGQSRRVGVILQVNVLGKCWVTHSRPIWHGYANTSKTLGIIGFRGVVDVPPVGFEPTTHDLKGRCSNR